MQIEFWLMDKICSVGGPVDTTIFNNQKIKLM